MKRVLLLLLLLCCSPAYADPPHPDDLAKQAEHLALLALVPPEEATSVVAQSGPWSDPATWESGQLPAPGERALVPLPFILTVDTVTAPLYWMRVEGGLHFDPGGELLIDTLIGTTTTEPETFPPDGGKLLVIIDSD